MKLSWRTNKKLRNRAKHRAYRRNTDWEDEIGEIRRRFINNKRNRQRRLP